MDKKCTNFARRINYEIELFYTINHEFRYFN